jgi:hypothetical protein
MYEWDSFLWSADEWLVSYSVPPLSLPSVKMFSVGHALEIYLKAANTKMTQDIGRAIGFGHDIKSLWDDCKRTDAAFMTSYEIDDAIFSAYLFNQPKLQKDLTREQWLRFLHNQELYVVAHFLPELK